LNNVTGPKNTGTSGVKVADFFYIMTP